MIFDLGGESKAAGGSRGLGLAKKKLKRRALGIVGDGPGYKVIEDLARSIRWT